MTRFRQFLFPLFFFLPFAANAAVSTGDFPDGTMWYMRADLKEMRSTDAGRQLYAWFDDEVFSELKDEIGIDLNTEVNRLTAFSNTLRGAVIVVEGNISDESRDKLLALAELEGSLEMLTYEKKTYYHIGNGRSNDGENGIDSLQDSAYFTFALKDRLIVASGEGQLKALLDKNGKIAGSGQRSGSLFVLTADKDFAQAGMRTEGLGDIDWDSNILRNIEQAAVLVADQDGMIAIEVRLVSSNPGMAKSVASIINGLISLQAFNADMDPAIAQVLENTKVDVADKVLSISTVVDPEVIVNVIAD
ncbi:MAG: hypothetical protein GXP15_00740 [Gammaproteobacteria bacterium]|nr:hypothetical protein [Gammaproteobacteria bacterium]